LLNCFYDTFAPTFLCSTEIGFFKEGFCSVITTSPWLHRTQIARSKRVCGNHDW